MHTRQANDWELSRERRGYPPQLNEGDFPRQASSPPPTSLHVPATDPVSALISRGFHSLNRPFGRNSGVRDACDVCG